MGKPLSMRRPYCLQYHDFYLITIMSMSMNRLMTTRMLIMATCSSAENWAVWSGPSTIWGEEIVSWRHIHPSRRISGHIVHPIIFPISRVIQKYIPPLSIFSQSSGYYRTHSPNHQGIRAYWNGHSPNHHGINTFAQSFTRALKGIPPIYHRIRTLLRALEQSIEASWLHLLGAFFESFHI